MKKILISSALILTLGILHGCAGSSGPIPDDQFYRLTGKSIQAESKKKLLNGSLEISRFKAKSLYNERAILYAHEDKPLKLKQYHYHYWADSPAQMIQESFATILSNAGIADIVSVSNPRIDYDYSLSGNILRFERIVGSHNGRVLASMLLTLTRRGDGKPLILKTYTREVTADSNSLYVSVEAFNTALSMIAQEFSQDMASYCATDKNVCRYK